MQRMLDIGSLPLGVVQLCTASATRCAILCSPISWAANGGTVEVDETYVGGKPRPQAGVEKPKRGRGTRKIPVVTLVERGGRVRSKMITGADSKTLKAAIRENVDYAPLEL